MKKSATLDSFLDLDILLAHFLSPYSKYYFMAYITWKIHQKEKKQGIQGP